MHYQCCSPLQAQSDNLDNDSYILGVLAKGTQDKHNTAEDATLLLR